jgi:cytochrome c oxidase assembly factor CtaG
MPSAVYAHAGEPLEPHDLTTLQGWVFDPAITIPLALAALLYWRGAAPGRGTQKWEARCYWAGWLTLFFSLVTPLHGMGEVLFSAHMTQHELLMLVAAPLLVLGRPLVPCLWSVPARWRRTLARPFLAPVTQRLWHAATQPFHAWWIHGVALWVWHIPVLYDASVRSDTVHALQHATFLASALLFWWALLRAPRSRRAYGTAAVYVFGTAVHSSVLGAMLTFAPSIWYPVYQDTTWAWGLSALEDQQLGGLIMWIPAGVLYTAAGLLLFAVWLRESEMRAGAIT